MNDLPATTANNGLAVHRVDYPALVEDALNGLAPTTQLAYRAGIDKLAVFLGLNKGAVNGLRDAFIALGPGNANQILLRWRAAMVAEGLAANTINLRLAAAKFLVKTARIGGLIKWSVEVKGVKSRPYRDVTGPGTERIQEMIEQASLRDKVIIMLMYTMRMRKHEIAALDLEDYDSAGHRLQVRRKGRHDKEWLYLDGFVEMTLDDWIKARGNQPGPLFPSRTGRRLEGTALWRIIKRLDPKTSPHRILHTSVTDALDATNGNVRDAAAFCGHSGTGSVNHYDDHRNNAQARISGILARKLEV